MYENCDLDDGETRSKFWLLSRFYIGAGFARLRATRLDELCSTRSRSVLSRKPHFTSLIARRCHLHRPLSRSLLPIALFVYTLVDLLEKSNPSRVAGGALTAGIAP